MTEKIIVIATKNKNKKNELVKLLKSSKIKVRTLLDLNMHIPEVIEDGSTFRQNAMKKALTFSRYVKGLVLADDSGIMVDALYGKPGIRSSRFARTKATDIENNAKLLRLVNSVPKNKRQATFVCVIAIAKNGNLIGTVQGESHGTIGYKLKGRKGFGYDPLFTPRGYKKTFAEMSEIYKNKISHRGKALKKAKTIIRKYFSEHDQIRPQKRS